MKDTTYIPSSKSISNRMLVMLALSGDGAEPENLSVSDDTRLLQKALKSGSAIKDIGHAGTAMRFLAAYFSTREGKVVLTGSDRMKERPVGPLVIALRELGATITYMEKEGCPPLEISGGLDRGGRITVDGGISSQFISALMMIGPVLKGGLQITLTGDVVSSTYIRMTLALMKRGGVEAAFNGREVVIGQGCYNFDRVAIESDWSGASYWYQVAALLPGSVIRLPHLERESLQGDAVLASLFEPLGVKSRFDDGGITLHSDQEITAEQFSADFTGCPDLVQTCAATLCGLGIPFRLTGTRTLRVKETDRIAGMQAELGKLGFVIQSDRGGDWISWDGHRGEFGPVPLIETYHDHRMAMAFAPLAIPFGPLRINDPMVVTKSYPGYWEDLRKAGFSINRC
ncbi:MAG: 3-phosphoshikimate 1-carboxyvinyltransferase [Bacteroidales bacterium]|nr:3-phosphoshikimate 1-carboxyvinyltransferase [Bacteroidales bacterium]